MERDAKKSPDSSAKRRDDDPERRQSSKSDADPILSDFDSGRGSGSTPQASDSTPGVEIKGLAISGLPYVPELKVEPAQSDSEVVAGKKSPERSPKMRSPVKAVRDGLRWMRDSLSPKKSDRKDDGSRSPKEGEGRQASKSPVRSPVKSIFRRKSRSPTKRRSSELEPFLLGDELRCSSSSSDGDDTAADTSPARGTSTNAKLRHQKRKGREQTTAAAYAKMEAQSCDTEDSSASSDALVADRVKSRKGLKLHLKKEYRKSKECDAPATWHIVEEADKLLPMEGVEIGIWSPVRMTPDEDDTRSPSETDVDLDSLTSRGASKATDETEREVSSTGERISKHLGLSDPSETDPGSSCLFKRVVMKRQSVASELRGMPDPSPSPKKQPKCDVEKSEARSESENQLEESESEISDS